MLLIRRNKQNVEIVIFVDPRALLPCLGYFVDKFCLCWDLNQRYAC